jgi:hypothetical protein
MYGGNIFGGGGHGGGGGGGKKKGSKQKFAERQVSFRSILKPFRLSWL